MDAIGLSSTGDVTVYTSHGDDVRVREGGRERERGLAGNRKISSPMPT